MSIEKHLENKKMTAPAVKFKKELEDVVNGNFLKNLIKPSRLKKEVAELGLELIRKNDSYYEYIYLGSDHYNRLSKLIPENIWGNPNYYALLVFFFGEEKAKYVRSGWDMMPFKMYQQGYERRSFRAPENKLFVILNQINFLRSVLKFPSKYDYTEGKTNYYDLTIEEQIIYDNDLTNGHFQYVVWSVALDAGNEKVYRLLEAILYGNHPAGKVTRNIVKALLNSSKKECWELVGKLLLSAQRQEGLRQTILESLDETSIGGLKYMIDVLIEYKLTRFSSVVRAVDTWTGLGWSAEKETTVRNILVLAQRFLNDPGLIAAGIQSKDNHEVYMALWVQGILNVEKTVPYLNQLMEKGTMEKKCLSLKFAGETGNPYIQMPLYFKALDEENVQVLAFALPGMSALLNANSSSEFYANNPEFPGFFEKIYELTQKIDIKEKSFHGKIFSWLNAKFEKDNLYQSLIYLVGKRQERLEMILLHFEAFSIQLRETVTQEILKDFYVYSYDRKDKKVVPTDFQRKFAMRILKDRGENILTSAMNVLENLELTTSEMTIFQDLLKRKNSSLRKRLMGLILKQDEKSIEPLVVGMLEHGDAEQRSASLELIVNLQESQRLNDKIPVWVKDFQEKRKLSEREEKLVNQLNPLGDKEVLSAENGYTLFDPGKRTPFELPFIKKDSIFSELTGKEEFGFSIPFSKIRKELDKLLTLYQQNANFEYQIENYDGSTSVQLLSNYFAPFKRNTNGFTAIEKFQNYPLTELWDQWFVESKLRSSDLFLLTLVADCEDKAVFDFLSNHVFYYSRNIPNPVSGHQSRWNNPLKNILEILQFKYPFQEKNEFLIDATVKLYSKLPREILKFKRKPDRYHYHSDAGDGWQSQTHLDVFLNAVKLDELTEEQVHKVWNIYRWRQFSGLKENVSRNMPPVYIYCKAFSYGFISQDEMFEGMLEPVRINVMTGDRKHYQHFKGEETMQDFPFLEGMLEQIREKFLDVELKRGDTGTSVTLFVQNFQQVFGMNRFVEIISAFGKGNLYKGYLYAWGSSELNKQQLLSTLLKRSHPRKGETQEVFNQLMKESKITELRLIQAAVYAPQWQSFISSYLGWKGLDSAIWWMHAHTKTSEYQSQNAELESEVAKYSNVDLQEFKDGAVDKDWFEKAYKELGKSRWEMLYDSAKYVSDGNGHRRARLYADTLLGDLKIREVTAKVKDKRDQEYLRVYGLVPLSKANAEKDILSRYEYLQQFKKESKEFGSMKQASEAVAIRVALENLARNAGYPDPVRLTWSMETKQVQNILSKETQVEIEDMLISLTIDKEGKADVICEKEGKLLKAVPAKLKKHPAVVELGKHKKTLREQFNRSRKGFEEAMIRGDEFQVSEMRNLFEHPVICRHLEKLVFVTNDNHAGFYRDGHLIAADKEEIQLNETHTLRIAHCFDLHAEKVWTAFQTHCFDHQLKQPFKQVFRELYVPTPDELQDKSISRRYAGHQVHPKQTLALLKSRGWKVDYEEGLQKVFHKEGYQVKLYAMADWFSPADTESPTLETIEFHSLKDYKNIPFEDINPRVFSEIMRDVDLVVSVAHVGGVDPEASHSSIEMRSVLLRETARLFKLDNIEMLEKHVKITGKLADYSVHLGSAVVHQIPGRYLSILPVHSQHRGRLFLPFADEDPKSAEVISKVLLLSKDNEIQDPTILSQIDRKISAT